MAEPEHHSSMHSFAYHPHVASWVQSTALAQLDGASDEVTEQPPDDFYQIAPAHAPDFESLPPAADMTSTRQRQQKSNGAVRSTPKPSVRSTSGSVTSSMSTPRSGPQVPSNRPTVKSLAQRFNVPSSAETSPLSSRARPVRPPQASANSSPARPAREASYGAYKFNNLKPRERPQPAPPSTANARRANGARSSLGHQASPSAHARKISSTSRDAGRQLFFGEVVGGQDSSTPGFGIPSFEGTPHGSDSLSPAPTGGSTIKIVTQDLHLLPAAGAPNPLSSSHQRSASANVSHSIGADQAAVHSPLSDSQTPRKRSPPSRIPVASRRLSSTSDSTTSSRSSKFGGARPVAYSRASPTRPSRVPVGGRRTSPRKANGPAQPTLPAVTYRGYRERGKSPQDANSGPSVAAVITAPLPPTSPRLRNSRERQTLQEPPNSRSKSADPHGSQDYFGNGVGSAETVSQQAQMNDTGPGDGRPSVKLVEANVEDRHADAGSYTQSELVVNIEDSSTESAQQPPPLSLSAGGLHVQSVAPPASSTTSFEYEDSPILGMPGSFLMTPPLPQESPSIGSGHADVERDPSPLASASEGEILQARTFQPTIKSLGLEVPGASDVQDALSELGSRESIPIMLGSDGPQAAWDIAAAPPSWHPPRLDTDTHRWQANPLDTTGVLSFLEDESPIDPFTHRDTLRPDDSASVAFYRQAGQRSPNWAPQMPDLPDSGSFTLNSEAYSVINKVLNMYHGSDAITPELAHDFREQVQNVSPIVAQHGDWGSKDATETYLARLLSDAASIENSYEEAEPATPEQSSPIAKQQAVPASSIRTLAEDPEEPSQGGTAIIFPSESQRYSRGSRGSGGSTSTTIWEGASRRDSSSGYSARDRAYGSSIAPLSFASHQPAKDWTHSEADPAQIQLPEIAGTGKGLGVLVHEIQQQQQQAPQSAPPRPIYSPPPPPGMGGVISRVLEQSKRRYSLQSNDNAQHATPTGQQPAVEEHMAARQSSYVPEVVLTTDDSATEAGPSAASSGPDEATKMARKRYRIIEELTKTEHSFCVDMMVAHQIFEGTSREVLNEQERRLLFCNCKDLESFSHSLWKALKESIKPVVNQTPPAENSAEPYDEFSCCTPENDRLVNIGAIMLQATTRMERVYTTYYLNYRDAADFIKKNANNPELLGWVMACFQHCPNLTSAWDLDSLLIKPCQRMLRYPLLLDELISKTSPDHPDLPHLKTANEAIKKIADRIEAAKSRQETLRAATSEGKKQKNKGRFGKTIVKALISNKDRAKNMQEAALIFEDQEYNQVTQKFGGHFFQIQIVIRDFDQYLEAITEQMVQLNTMMLGFITVSESGPSANAEMESTWRRWAMAYLDLQNKALDEHKMAVRNRVMKPICEVWDQWVSPQKLMEQRKKALLQYAKYKQAVDRKEKVDPKLEEPAKDFLTINDSLKQELPRLYELSKKCIRLSEIIFLGIQKDWYKTCSKKILPLLESEPQHTTSITYDFKVYVDRFRSDYRQMEDRAKSFAIVNHDLLPNIAKFTSPNPTFLSDETSSRKSSSRRTESISSEMSSFDHRNRTSEMSGYDPRNRSSEMSGFDTRNRNSGGYNSSSRMRSFDGPPRSSPAAPYAGPSIHPGPPSAGLANTRERVSTGSSTPYGYNTDGNSTITQARVSSRPSHPWSTLEAANYDDSYTIPPQMGASFLNPMIRTPTSTTTSTPGSSRTSGVFNSALPMTDGGVAAPPRPIGDDMPVTPGGDLDEPEVLFLAASLFEFNIAHDRREGGIPYLVYVPGEIFDVIGMKGELWLARNQDDSTRTVGWIWEKHFARILPEDA